MFWIILFSKLSSEVKMEKPKFKKNIHFNREEEIYVAKMITDGADYEKVAK